ncbi:hypothetical protein DIURU_005456 [Diutina rugosa]|uniref:Importin N-terminal domain-containing protein n=1 Tax=Diutina rugosa TaxID=5481 RepID=A0A642UD33_DIURU|nr:uncharacterized protein DIURU_005456 [Diutina rugosa]KAA8896943.1 hypothetical protein DIURU_005456 [Diutina rugosa]
MDDTTHSVLTALRNTLDAEVRVRQDAESQLRVFEQTPDFTTNLLAIIGEPSVDRGTQIAAAIFFKNRVAHHWLPPDNKPATSSTIPVSERDSVKNKLITSLIATYQIAQIRSQLSSALNTILSYDKWEQMGDIITNLIGDGSNTDHVYVGLICLFEYTKNYRWDGLESSGGNPVVNEITEKTFPLLEQLVPRLVSSDSPQSAEMLYLILKIFKFVSCMQLPPYLKDFSNLGKWCQLQIDVINHPLPPSVLAEDVEHRSQLPWVKAVKWCFGNLHRLLSRHGGGFFTKDKEGQFATYFLENFVPQILQAYWKIIERWSTKEVWLSEGALYYLISFIEQLVQTPAWSLVSDKLEAVIKHVVFPTLNASEETIELYEDDPDEYIRRFFDLSRDANTSDVASINLIFRIANKRFDETGNVIIGAVNEVLAQRAQDRSSPAIAKQVEGALRILSTISFIISHPDFASLNQVDQMLTTFVYPELSQETMDTFPWLTARACDMLSMFDHRYVNKEVSQQIFEAVVQCFQQQKQFPIRITAVPALCTLVEVPSIAEQVEPQAPQLMESLLEMSKKFESEILTTPMQTFVEKFSKVLEPFSTQLAQQLVEHFVTLATELGENGYSPEQSTDLDKEYQALGILSTLTTLINTVSNNPSLGRQMEQVVKDMVKFVFDNALVSFLPETIEILDSILYATNEMSPTMWELYRSVVDAFDTYAYEYFDQITPFFEGVVNYGFKSLSIDSPHVQSLINLCTGVLRQGTDGVFAHKAFEMLELVILALGNKMAPVLPAFLEEIFSIFMDYEEQNAFDGMMLHHLSILRVLFSAIFADANIALKFIEDKQFVASFLNLWVKHSEDFQSVYGCKLQILAALSMMRSDQLSVVPVDCVSELTDLLFSNFAALPGAIKARQEILSKDVREYNPNDDVDDEYEVDEAEMEALKLTPIDEINVFTVLTKTIDSLQQTNAQRYQTLFGEIDDTQRALLHQVYAWGQTPTA